MKTSTTFLALGITLASPVAVYADESRNPVTHLRTFSSDRITAIEPIMIQSIRQRPTRSNPAEPTG